MEEATFYKPAFAGVEIKSLVVLGIRNSLLEDLHSTVANNFRLDKQGILREKDIEKITKEAIKYFSSIEIKDIVDQSTLLEYEDPFSELPNKYPVAWEALKNIAICNGLSNLYGSVQSESYSFFGESKDIIVDDLKSIILSGIDPHIDKQLGRQLKMIQERKQKIFFSPSFKMITRHPDKLYKVLDIILRSDATLVTFNYFIRNGFVAKREKLLKPIHSQKEMKNRFYDMRGLDANHRAILEGIRNQLF